jgi:hypothetical protein
MLLTRPPVHLTLRTMASTPSANRAFSLKSTVPRKLRAEPISPMVVRLTEQEDEICTLLDDFCRSKNKDAPEGDPLVCRIAGGWVRDKVSSTHQLRSWFWAKGSSATRCR